MISTNEHYIRGRKKFEAQDFAGALKDYNLAIRAEENPNLYSERAVVWYYLQDKEKSLADMNHAAALEPENPYRYSSRAYIKDWIGDIQGAIADYERAVELDPEDSIAYNNLGLLQEKLGYVDKAKANYQRADQLEGVDELLDNIRKEHEQKAKKANKTPEPISAEERNELSLMALLRITFTTKKGMQEFVQFIKNGFRVG